MLDDLNAICVVVDDGHMNDGIVKDQIYHVDPGVTVSHDDRHSVIEPVGRWSMVWLYGNKENIEIVKNKILEKAAEYKI